MVESFKKSKANVTIAELKTILVVINDAIAFNEKVSNDKNVKREDRLKCKNELNDLTRAKMHTERIICGTLKKLNP